MRNATIEDRWQQLLFRNADGAPVVPARFVLESGPGVLLVDVRDAAAAAGPLGYIRGSAFVGGADLDALVANADREPIVLIDELGVGAAALARRLEAAGGTRVAAMAGGLANWRALGFLTTRDPSGIAGDLAVDGGMAQI